MGCGEFIVKYVLFIVNLVFVLAGLTLVGLGIAVELKASAVTDFLESVNVSLAPIFTIVVGTIVFFIAFFGCCGAIRESNCMLVSYGIFMIILMILKIALAVLIFVNIDEFNAQVAKNLNSAFNADRPGFQSVESTFSCCGTTGANAYESLMLPNTCCSTTPCTPLNAFDGCVPIVQKFIDTFGITMGIIVIAVAAMELVAVVFSLCLANSVRNKSRRERY